MELDTIVCGDCLDILPTIPDQSVDAVITDPPYPCIKRDYGYWTIEEWWELMVEGVIPEVRRILKPTGSAVFILQPNSEKVGKMRGWLWEFMAWVCREWNMVQDFYWWHYSAPPTKHANRSFGLARPSVKICMWCGSINCYRNQDNVLLEFDRKNAAYRIGLESSDELKYRKSGSGWHGRNKRIWETAIERGGTTPFNMLPLANHYDTKNASAYGHGAGTPLKLADWWTRYIVPPGGVSVDPFIGTGTMAVAAIKNHCHFFGCDTMQGYVDSANERIEKARLEMAQLEMFTTRER